jgi:hypothetical protein
MGIKERIEDIFYFFIFIVIFIATLPATAKLFKKKSKRHCQACISEGFNPPQEAKFYRKHEGIRLRTCKRCEILYWPCISAARKIKAKRRRKENGHN